MKTKAEMMELLVATCKNTRLTEAQKKRLLTGHMESIGMKEYGDMILSNVVFALEGEVRRGNVAQDAYNMIHEVFKAEEWR